MAKKLRLKKKFKIIGIIIILLIIGSIIVVKQYKIYKYHQTYEYKLIEHGYTKDEASSLINTFNDTLKIDEILKQNIYKTLHNLTNEKYFIANNLDHYEAYLKKNPN